MTSPSTFRFLVLCVAMAAFLGAGCGDSAPSAGGPKPGGAGSSNGSKDAAQGDGAMKAAPLDKVSLQLNWHPEMEHGGFYAAQVHGYFREAGLEVEIRPGVPGAPVGPQVAGGQTTFGCDNADKLLQFRAQGADLVALMAPLQTSPRCLIVHADSPIKTFDDLKNVTLAMANQPWAEFLKKKLPLEGVELVPNQSNLALFLGDKKFVQQAYVFSEPFVAEQRGTKVRSLLVSDLGFNPYASLLITNGELLKSKPDVAKRMTAASLRGWRKYLEDPAPTNEAIHKVNPEMSLEALAAGVEAMKPLCHGDNPSALVGRMDPERWATLVKQLVDVGSIKPDSVDPATAFTTEFLTEETTP